MGLPPAGGWTTSRAIMRKIPIPTDIAIKRYAGPENILVITTAGNAVIKWPKKILMGCANGLSGKPYVRTKVAPKDTASNIIDIWIEDKYANIPIVSMEANPAISALKTLDMYGPISEYYR